MYSSFCKFEIWIGFKSFSSNSLYCANNCFLDLFKHTIAVYVIAVNGWKCFKSHTLSNSDLFAIYLLILVPATLVKNDEGVI